MKSSVAIALIICGTLLVAIPFIHNTIAIQQMTNTMVALNKTVNLTADVPKHADTVCMTGGIVMIATGAIFGRKENK